MNFTHQVGESKKAFDSVGRTEALRGGGEPGGGQDGSGRGQRSPQAPRDGSLPDSFTEIDQHGLGSGEGGRRV